MYSKTVFMIQQGIFSIRYNIASNLVKMTKHYVLTVKKVLQQLY